MLFPASWHQGLRAEMAAMRIKLGAAEAESNSLRVGRCADGDGGGGSKQLSQGARVEVVSPSAVDVHACVQ